jgi:hypothetical protein
VRAAGAVAASGAAVLAVAGAAVLAVAGAAVLGGAIFGGGESLADERFEGVGAALGDRSLVVSGSAGQVLGSPQLVGHRSELGGDAGAGDRVELGEQVVHAGVVVDPHRRLTGLTLALSVGVATIG